MSYSRSEFANGHWEWSEDTKGVVFISHKVVEVDKPQQQSVEMTQAAGCSHGDLELTFRDTFDNLEQIRFRRTIQRQIRPNEVETVILQDIKDIVLFQSVSKLPAELIDMIHTHEADRFFRALIFYFQLFLQVCDELSVRRVVGERKVRQPNTIVVENVIRDNLADLRGMIAREYGVILMGYGRMRKYHHMANNMHASAPERDIRLFELLMRIAIRVVWIALQRRSLNLIEYEVNRMLRTQEFNMASRRTRASLIPGNMPVEQRVLYGDKREEVSRLLARSPAAVEMLNIPHDFRLLGAGFFNYEKKDERIQFLEAAYTAAERDLHTLQIPFGILGKPREDFDAMLVPLLVPEESLDAERELCYKSLAISSLTYMTTESKTYDTIRLPVGEDDMEDAVPAEYPNKGDFMNKSDSKEQERVRLMWRALKAKK